MSSDIPLTLDQKAMFNELGLQRDATNSSDTKQLISILTQKLYYPSDRLANIHREASRLGTYDEASQRRAMKQEFKKTGVNFEICECCCCIQQDSLKFSTDIEEIETVSQSILVFFSDLRYIVVWCFISFMVFGIFAISTNILSYDKYPQPDLQKCIRSRCVFHLISLGSKLSFNETERAHMYYIWETWFRVLIVVVWILFFILKAKRQKSISVDKQIKNITASDFAILIQDLPIEYDKAALQNKLDKYAKDLSYKFKGRFLQEGDEYDMKLTIVDFNEAEPYYKVVKTLKQHEQFSSQKFLKERKDYLKQWICFRQNNTQFPVSLAQRQNIYCQIEAKQLQMAEQIRQLGQNAQNIMRQQQIDEQKRPVIVSFHHNYAKINMLNLNQLPWYSKIFKCFRQVPYTLNIPGITIEPAPEPQDIIWENIGVPLKINIFRKLLTSIATFSILFISCVGLYFLSIYQTYADHWLISFLISIFISGINYILIIIIYYLSWKQNNNTHTNFEISVANKSIIAQLINSVILNIFINLMTKRLFEKGGLAEDVLFLSITSAFLPPIVRVINGADIWNSMVRWWYSFARSKLNFQSQRQYNILWERAAYQIGYNYVFIVKTTLFTAFFLSLQPIIALISCLGIILMYYAEKYTLFYRSIKPRPRSLEVNMQMGSLLRLCIFSFALGNLLFSQIIPESHLKPKDKLLDFINLAFGAIIYLIPLTIILKKLEQIPESIGLNYLNQKIFLTSQYQRVNPLTREEGIRNFGQYINQLKTKYNKLFPQMISQVLDLNKDHPVQTISKLKASVKVHHSRYRKGSMSYVSQDLKSGIKQQSQFFERSRRDSITPDISLQQDGKIQAPANEAVKMSTVRDQSQFLNNSFLNDLIKPKEVEEQKQKQITKAEFNILSFIQQIIDREDDDDLSLRKQYSLPVKSFKSINRFAQKYKQSLD